MSKENSERAFPGFKYDICSNPSCGFHLKKIGANDGMTIRDYFAAKAMQAMIGNTLKSHYGKDTVETFAKYSYEFSDAMLKARN